MSALGPDRSHGAAGEGCSFSSTPFEMGLKLSRQKRLLPPPQWFLPLPPSLQDTSPQERPPMDHPGAGRAKEEASPPPAEQ